ncbi:MAG: hypothetical protein ABIP44_01245 [Pseudoxanthomonas sp.]
MALLTVIDAIWKGFKAADDAGELGNMTISVAGLSAAQSTIEMNIRSYVGNKSAANTQAVTANIRHVRTYLKTISVQQPGIKDLVDSSTATKYQVSIVLANYASKLSFDINMAVASGNLPQLDETPWSSRRGGFVRQQDNFRSMTMQFEAVLRRKRKELGAITAFEARLFGLAFADGLTDADLRMIQNDMNEQKREEDSTRRTLGLFTMLVTGSRNNFVRLGEIIQAGDRANTKKK